MNAQTRTQTLITDTGEELVVLSRADYDALVAAVETADFDEDADDVAAFDAAMAAGLEPLPPEVSARILRGEGRVAAWRKYRNLSQGRLAALTGISQGYVSQIENGARGGDPETLAALAAALDIPVEWIS